MANEITPVGTARTLRTPRSKSVTDKQKNIPVPQKKSKDGEKKKSDDGGQIHIDEYI
ncbi:MAG: hypothetical protein KBT88_07060 [Gammaproteobacteria bacterium]|nr:hypothetical protein [Gammaproteobacteria bacterium]MBQ0839531.1 hypothetical protein [Gammaproteobacteria bacterium]